MRRRSGILIRRALAAASLLYGLPAKVDVLAMWNL